MNMTARQVEQYELQTPKQPRVEPEHRAEEKVTSREMEDSSRLKQWGAWGRANYERLGYAKLPAFQARGWGEADLSEVIERISDDEGMRIDAAVSSLPDKHWHVVLAIYLYRVPWLKLPELLRMGRRQIEFYQGQAVGIIWTKLRGAQA